MKYIHAAFGRGDVRVDDGGYVWFKKYCVAQVFTSTYFPERPWRLRYTDNWMKLGPAQASDISDLVEPHINLLNVTARLMK